MKKICRFLFSCLMLTALAIPAKAITIDVYHAWPGHRHFHDAVAQEFMKKHPDIKVHFLAPAESYDFAHQTMVRNALTGNLPDVFHSGYHLLPELVRILSAKKQIVDLTPFINKEGGKAWIKKNFNPAIINLTTIDKTVWAMPFNASTPIIFFNADLVKKAGGDPAHMPTDWNGWIALAGKIHALGDNISGMGYDVNAWPDDWLWRALISQQGEPFMNPDGTTVAWDGESGKKALQLCVRFIQEGGMKQMEFGQAKQQFVAGLTGFTFQSVNSARSFEELSQGKFTLGSAIYPVANIEKGTVPTGGNGAVITAKDPEKQAAAWEYIKFASSPEGQKIAVMGSGYMPTNQLAMAPALLGDFYAKNPNWRTSLDQIDRAEPWAGYPGTNSVEIWRTQRDLIAAVMAGEISVDEGLKKMVEQTNRLIGK